MPNVWNVAEPLEVEYRQPIRQISDQSNSGRKEIEKQPYREEIEGQESRSIDSLTHQNANLIKLQVQLQ